MRVGLRSGGGASPAATGGGAGACTGTSSLTCGSVDFSGGGGRSSIPAGNVRQIVFTRGQRGRQLVTETVASCRGTSKQRTLGARCSAPFIPEAKISTRPASTLSTQADRSAVGLGWGASSD